ncbi:MAG: YccF domain-containing protein [Geitlerinemataceae cyanobacterium]
MSFLGNVIWLIFGGFFAGLGYIIGGLSLCLTIVGIPFGIQTIKIGFATMTPFGREIVEVEGGESTLATIFNVIWVVLFGWEIAIAHLVSAAILAITIVGIPFAVQHWKLLSLSIWPFGRTFR